jgi:GTP cyclohydrolase IA
MKSPFDNHEQTALHRMSESVSSILSALGEDVMREGLKETPKRVAKSFLDLTAGYQFSVSDVVGDAIFPCQGEGMILQNGIEFFSLCEHHLLPFFGEVKVAYLPDRRIIGLSKIGRIIDIFAKRLQVQEHLNHQIADALDKILSPKGLAVVIEAKHFCMMMRGVKKQVANTLTSEFRGVFKTDPILRSDFLQTIKK